MLDPEVPLQDQLNYLPGGVIIIIYGITEEGEVVRNRVMWTFTNGCGERDMPIFKGGEIGCVTFVSDLRFAYMMRM